MKVRMFFGALVLIGATALATQVVSQDGAGEMDPAEAEMMAKWMEFMTPGEPHQMLSSKAGNWTMTSEMWMAPGAPPVEATGSSTVETIMDGRYVVEKTKMSMMGMEHKGMGIAGYDNLKKKFFAVWLDSAGTGVMVLEGTKRGNAIYYYGTGPDLTAGEYVPMRMVETHVTPNHTMLEMYGPGPDGKEFLSMKMHTKRAAKKTSGQ